MYEQFVTLAKESPERAALIDGATGRVTTRLDLLERARAAGSQLASAGLVPKLRHVNRRQA